MTNTPIQPSIPGTDIFRSAPWAADDVGNGARIQAYIESLGEWKVVAETKNARPVNATKIAEQIVRAINDAERSRSLLAEMAAALEACLDCSGLDFTAEHDGEVTLKKYRALVKVS
jgi:hypothetical protein